MGNFCSKRNTKESDNEIFSLTEEQFYDQFGISSEYGACLPPEESLPEILQDLDELAKTLPSLIKSKQLHEKIATIPIKQIDSLSKSNLYLSYTIYSYLIQGFLYADENNGKYPQVLPKQLAIPFSQICEKLKLPTLCPNYFFMYRNWEIIDKSKPISLENIKCRYTWTGTSDEDRFMILGAIATIHFGKLYQGIFKANKAIQQDDVKEYVQGLANISDVMEQMRDDIKKIYGLVQPEVYHEVFRFYIGSMSKDKFPDGLLFEGLDKRVNDISWFESMDPGYQVIEKALGVVYEPGYQMGKIQLEFRKTMPQCHLELIKFIEKNSDLRDFALYYKGDAKTAYNKAVESYDKFLVAHRFVIINYYRKNNPHWKGDWKKYTEMTLEDEKEYLKDYDGDTFEIVKDRCQIVRRCYIV